jgi:archaellum component FlaC
MEAVREKWTDERLDDMNDRMGEGFARLDKDIREVRSEMAGVRAEVAGVRTELAETKTEILGEMNSCFEAMHRLIIQVGGGLVGTMAIGFLGLALTQH